MAKKKRAQPRRDNTRDRIIEKSIDLFNRHGLRNVSISQIAEKAKMSPGNLTYHFPFKRELIIAALAVMKERMRLALAAQREVQSAVGAASYLLNLYRTLWDCRFFFNSLTFVLADAQLRREYLDFRDWMLMTLESNLLSLSRAGLFVPQPAPNSFSLLAENLWALWLHWLRSQQDRAADASEPGNETLYECALHDWSITQSWMHPSLAPNLIAAFRSLLSIDADSPSTLGHSRLR